MDKQHQQVITTSPMAMRGNQTRVHVRKGGGPWNHTTGTVACPNCDAEYILTDGFRPDACLKELAKNHEAGTPHPDVIASDPAFTRITACDCNKDGPHSWYAVVSEAEMGTPQRFSIPLNRNVSWIDSAKDASRLLIDDASLIVETLNTYGTRTRYTIMRDESGIVRIPEKGPDTFIIRREDY